LKSRAFQRLPEVFAHLGGKASSEVGADVADDSGLLAALVVLQAHRGVQPSGVGLRLRGGHRSAKERGLCIREDIALCEPDHVVALASIIRRWVIAAHRARTTRCAAQKAQRLYDYLAGDSFRVDLAAVAACTCDLDAELLTERDQHERTWGRRAHLQEQLRTAHLRISATLEGELAEDAPEPISLANDQLTRTVLAH
jgi:hypothetical protein